MAFGSPWLSIDSVFDTWGRSTSIARDAGRWDGVSPGVQTWALAAAVEVHS